MDKRREKSGSRQVEEETERAMLQSRDSRNGSDSKPPPAERGSLHVQGSLATISDLTVG